MERRKTSENISTQNNSNVEQQISLSDKKHESFSWLQDEKNKEIVKEYINAQLEKTDMSDIYKLQQLYFGTSSLSYMKEIVPDVTGYTGIEEYKTASQKLLKDL